LGRRPATLEVRELEVHYERIRALSGISLSVEAGEIVAIVGANGAGKTTTMRTVAGLLRPTRGQVLLDGQRIDGLAPETLVRRGICLVPEGRRIFPGLTVYENLEVATAAWRRRGQSLAPDLERVYALFPRLRERQSQLGWSLSGGEQQMLAIGRALMAHPRLLLLDEPSLGLAPILTREIFRIVRAINRDEGVSVLLVEQNAAMALELADHAYLLETGRVVMSGPSADLQRDDSIRRSYLGY
jgi:branched-chain amino acid transport system ATP-binding protein